MSDLLASALSGSSRAYLPYAWEALPGLVNLRSDGRWWTDPVTSRRLALDLMGSTRADGVTVAVLHAEDWASFSEEDRDALVFDALDVPAVNETLSAIRSLAASVPAPVVGALPDLQALTASLIEEDATDVLCDLARGALEAGVSALLVVAVPADHDVIGRITRLADNFGVPVLVLSPAAGEPTRGTVGDWTVSRSDALGAVSLDGAAESGVILTPGDVSTVWSREQLARHGAGG